MLSGSSKAIQFVFRFSPEEKQMLVELSEKRGQAGAEILRQCVRREYAKTFGKDAEPSTHAK